MAEILIIILAIQFNQDFQIILEIIPEIDIARDILPDIFLMIRMAVIGDHQVVDLHQVHPDVSLHREILTIDLGHIKLRLP